MCFELPCMLESLICILEDALWLILLDVTPVT